MSQNEESKLNTFFAYVCELPISLLIPNYSAADTACILLEGSSLSKGRIIGALLYREEMPSKREIDKFGITKMFSVLRIDVSPQTRGRGFGERLLQKTVEHLTSKTEKPFLIRLEKSHTLGSAPEKLGFESLSGLFLYKTVR